MNVNEFRGRKKKNRVVGRDQRTGQVKRFRVYAGIPKGCKTPKQICIKCLKTVIHKNDMNYESKTCADCKNINN